MFGKYTVKYSGANDITTEKISGGYIQVTPGIAYQLFKNFQMELSLANLLSLNSVKVTHTTTLPPVVDYTHSFTSFTAGTNGGVLNNLGIGFKFIF